MSDVITTSTTVSTAESSRLSMTLNGLSVVGSIGLVRKLSRLCVNYIPKLLYKQISEG